MHNILNYFSEYILHKTKKLPQKSDNILNTNFTNLPQINS